MADDRRKQLIEYVEREFIGPDPIDWEGLRQENGEEILVSDSPRTKYLAGILFPWNSRDDDNSEDINSDEELVADNDDDNENDEPSPKEEKKSDNASIVEYLEDAEELIDRSNAFKQSAMSITVAISHGDSIKVKVDAATYKKVDKKNNDGKTITEYWRIPLSWESEDKIEMPVAVNSLLKHPVSDSKLAIDIVKRYQKSDYSIFTFTIENTNRLTDGKVRDEDCYFQVKMTLYSEKSFHDLPEEPKINKDEDYLSNLLLYRNVKNYAIGHGCAAIWDGDRNVKSISTSIFPSYEVKPIVPNAIDGVNLSMIRMSKDSEFDSTLSQMNLMCERYSKWIMSLEESLMDIPEEMKSTAHRHIDNCKKCLDRMNNGVNLLSKDPIVKRAFMWMNEAMLLQQLHYGLPLQKWTDDKTGYIKLEKAIDVLPSIEDKSTWYDTEKKTYGVWRPFQLAFILMNLESMKDPNSKEREILDLIWFPTGGGKTEAYLGLSAYTIFVRRLMDKNNTGTSIIMRYTLRLLTAQQYERASAMICACEVIRNNNVEALGEEEISIGLWVGGDTTPNKNDKAVKQYNDIKNHKSESNPFVMLKCPWCGAQMGIFDSKNKVRYLPGYKVVTGARKSKRFVFRCANEEQKCHFSTVRNLPLYIIDDDIYEKKPTLILGTVDKFAMLPFRPEARGLFGYQNGVKVTSPDLIIQDELHLISGPLGSMVGHYETLINDLCKQNTSEGTVYPKIIASTATISRAKRQCHALYGCDEDKVFQFPPAGLDSANSFFAKEDNTKNGRRYVGIMASASPSDTTTAIRLFAALLYATKTMSVEDEALRDPYWTNVGYYNSIRELGQAQTWIKADISQYLDVMYKRRYDDKRFEKEEYKKYRRYIWRDEELTSRITGDKVSASLANMSISYPPELNDDGKVEEYPIDICLATNMISVGLDVQRLGLMTVAGQPKTTSEYIQATSRVGRDSANAPGLVFVLYRPSRPRDKSYYEHFNLYHSKLYCNVEPTSVTPFSSPVRERALHAILFGLMRMEQDDEFNDDPPAIPNKDLIKKFKAVIENRVETIDSEELNDTLKRIEYILRCWEDWDPIRWTPRYDYNQAMGVELPLMYGAGNKPNVAWLNKSFKTPTSMRSVDSSCEAKVLYNRYEEGDE